MNLERVLEKYLEANVQTNIIVNEIDDLGVKYVVVEAPPEGLRFLAEVLLALADDAEECEWPIAPGTGGLRWFDERSPKGLFIHRFPCGQERLSEIEDAPGDRPKPPEPPANA